MPGLDGTGPLGQGAMTGGRRGFCCANFGRGRRFLGHRSRYMQNFYGINFNSNVSEIDLLKQDAEFLKEQLVKIEERISVLEKN